MINLLNKISLQTLIVLTLFLGGAPFRPEPHLWQKFKMIGEGALTQPIDMLDLAFHLLPAVLLVLKLTIGRPSDGA